MLIYILNIQRRIYMAYIDLRAFIQQLENKGLLVRVKTEVDPILEIAEITDRMCKSPGGGKALFFENVKGSAFPVATNLFGSFQRMCLALEVEELDDIAKRIKGLLNQAPPRSFMEKLSLLPKLVEFSRFFPKHVKSAPCQEVIEKEDPDLGKFPVIKCWPGDGMRDEGRFSTLPLVFTKDPETGRPTAVCTAYIFMIKKQPECTGIYTRMEQGIMKNTKRWAAGCRLQLQ